MKLVRNQISQSLSSQIFPRIVYAMLLSTVLLCYCIAIYQGHVNPFPYTDITHTGMKYPEDVIFRVLMIGLIPFVAVTNQLQQSMLAQLNCPTRRVLRYLTIIFSVAFSISTSSISSNKAEMIWPLHIIAANATFIALYIRLMLIRHDLAEAEETTAQHIRWWLSPIYVVVVGTIVSDTILAQYWGWKNGVTCEVVLLAYLCGYFECLARDLRPFSMQISMKE